MSLSRVLHRILTAWYGNVRVLAIKLAKTYDEYFIHRKLRSTCDLIERHDSGAFRVGQVAWKKLMTHRGHTEVLTFEQVLQILSER